MTDIDIAKMRELLAKATPGPWTLYCRDVGNPTNDPNWNPDGFLQFELKGPAEVWGRGDFIGPDAALIAAARNDLPALLDEIARLRSDRAKVQAEAWEEAAKVADRHMLGNIISALHAAHNGACLDIAASIRALEPGEDRG